MLEDLKKRLQKTQGRSEFIMAVVCDIRGFSQFSTVHEVPDIAMFIKRFYLTLLDVYFTSAVFAKPTGDGLLLVFPYSEADLLAVSDSVLHTCFKVMANFPSMFQNDPMINFATPPNLGFGVARGTACCLFSGNRVLDYSGQLLNLAARLNDLARPQGVIVDGTFQENVIPKDLRRKFQQRRAYIRSIAEESSREILCSKEVTLPTYAQSPLTSHKWLMERKEITVAELRKLGGDYHMTLHQEVLTPEKTKLEFLWPNQKVQGYTTWRELRPYECFKDTKGSQLEFDTSQVLSIVATEGLSPETKVAFEFQYVPKPKKANKAK